jgi:hypothetical protein
MNNDFDRQQMAREFAKIILQSGRYDNVPIMSAVFSMAHDAYALADAMIEEGAKPREKN